MSADFKFVKPLYHPNIYKDGKLCISILHTPGDDEMSGELASERWTPAQRVESVLLSIISLLDDAECSSPANVDAGVMLRKDPAEFKRLVKEDVERSKNDIPEDFAMPDSDVPAVSYIEKPIEDRDFWFDSDAEDGFGGSDTDAEMTQDEGDESPDQEEEEEEEEDTDMANEDEEEESEQVIHH